MAETSGSNSESWRQRLMLAKMLLRQYGILHEFHVKQLENYPIACCKISLDGDIEVDADRRLVSFNVRTLKEYKKKNGEVVPRAQFSLYRTFKISKQEYQNECELALINLNTWTKELLWGINETKVKVLIDGREITGK